MVDPLSTSDKVLDKSVIQEPPREFNATFAEWAADNVEQIVKARSNTAGIIFTVPDNFTFFMTGCFITASESANVAIHGSAVIQQTGAVGNEPVYAIVIVDHVAGGHAGAMATTQSFPMPIKIRSGEGLSLNIGLFNTPIVTAGIFGYLLPKKISIR